MPPDRQPNPRRPALAFLFALGSCLVILLIHAVYYSFHCDDAYISFRYARNLAEGYGLVFNPGFERVEGYTNFLWVLILALPARFGLPPESVANPLSILMSLGLALWVIRFCWRHQPSGTSVWWILVPALVLVTNRSYAVWSTGGLETRLFELLVVGGVLTSLDELAAMRAGTAGRFPWSMLLLALATLARPDGLLISASVVGTRIVVEIAGRSFRIRPLAIGAATFAGLVGGHFLFRRVYYGDWLPNTYYAKVSGQTWWDMGGLYLSSFAVEYALVLWLPLLAAAVVGLYRWKRADILPMVAAAIVPHAIYVAAIGGDHFEYRMLDLYVPLLAVLLYFGACTVGLGRWRSVGATAYLALILFVSISIPLLTHLDAPSDYRPGFPGLTAREDGRTDPILPERHAWFAGIPGMGAHLRRYNELTKETSRHLVGVRQEEHERFFATVRRQGLWLSELVESGRLPRDLHVAISCVGAIPYYSGLRTLDRLGLTDREVARQPLPEAQTRVLAHERMADPVYAARRGADLWAIDNVHLILPLGHPRLHYAATIDRAGRAKPLIADVGGDRYLLAFAVQGKDALQTRCPNLEFRPASEYLSIEAAAGGFAPVARVAQLDAPYDVTYLSLAALMVQMVGDPETARLYVDRALRTNPRNPEAARMLRQVNLGGGR